MDRLSLVQIGFNLVFLVNIFYLHRRLAALRKPLAGARADLVEHPEGDLRTQTDAHLGSVGIEASARLALAPGAAPAPPAPARRLSRRERRAAVKARIEEASAAISDVAAPARRLSWREKRAAARALRSGSILELGGSAGPRKAEAESEPGPSAIDTGTARSLVRDGAVAGPAPASASRPASLDDLIAAAERAETGAVLQARVRMGSPAEGQPAARGADLPAPARKVAPESWWSEVQAGPGRDGSTGSVPSGTRVANAGPEPVGNATGALRATLVDASRQRAAEDLRANIRRLQMRYERSAQRRGTAGGSAQ